MSNRLRAAWIGLLCLCAAQALSAPRAWLDRDRIHAGETVTLNIQVEGHDHEPDLAPLDADFIRHGMSSQRETRLEAGEMAASVLYGIILEPRREGVLGVPRLDVGGQATEPLALTVLPAVSEVDGPGDDVFIDSELDTDTPYVQQSVAYTVRLHYAVTLLDGQLEVPEPEDAALQRVGEDVTEQRSIAGRRYNVVERRFLLTPERSGPLELPAPRFRGRALGGRGFGSFTQDSRIAARGPALPLQVRPQPASASTPWLPLRALDVSIDRPPEQGRAGEPLLVTLRLRADGAGVAQLPDLTYPEIPGAQVFPEPAEVREQWRDGRVQATATRRFAIVPDRPGLLSVPDFGLGWWDVEDDLPRTAQVPGFQIEVAEPAGGFPDVGAPGAAPAPAPAASSGALWPWRLSTLLLAVLCVALSLRIRHRPASDRDGPPPQPSRSAPSRVPLARALQAGDLGDIADALEAACGTRGRGGLEAARRRLRDPSQRAAVEALQRALWGQGDPRAARERLRAAFAEDLVLDAEADAGDGDALPVLYPRR